jgi:hypothetical protein
LVSGGIDAFIVAVADLQGGAVVATVDSADLAGLARLARFARLASMVTVEEV